MNESVKKRVDGAGWPRGKREGAADVGLGQSARERAGNRGVPGLLEYREVAAGAAPCPPRALAAPARPALPLRPSSPLHHFHHFTPLMVFALNTN